jgi:hypothetical protein
MIDLALTLKDFIMLLPYLKVLNAKKVVLGSQSRARHELLQTQVSYILYPEA